MTTRSGTNYREETEVNSEPTMMEMMQAMMARFERMESQLEQTKEEMKEVKEQMAQGNAGRVEQPPPPPENPPLPPRNRNRHPFVEDDFAEDAIQGNPPLRDRQGRRPYNPEEEVLKQVRVEAPLFDGSLDPQVCQDWLDDMDQFFSWYEFLEARHANLRLLRNKMGKQAADGAQSFLSDKSAKIFVAGHRGLVGSAVHRKLLSLGFHNLVLRAHAELDLSRQSDFESFFVSEQPAYVILCAAKVGGIHANSTYPADFIAVNLQIQNNVIDAAHRCGATKKLIFLGSSCIYPKHAPQPIPESALLTSALEPTNEWYAVAKIAGIKMCQAYRIQYGWDAISAMPTNLYGPNDNFHPENSHVLPGLMRRFHEAKASKAKEVVVWGTGSPLREFLHVDDLADAVVFLMGNYSGLEHVNVGSGKEVTIKELAEMVKEVVGFEGELVWDRTKPDGTPRKLMDSSKLAGLGWEPKISLREGLAGTYKWYLEKVVSQQ